jgi:hypothetical protein
MFDLQQQPGSEDRVALEKLRQRACGTAAAALTMYPNRA